jgi:hypothetical protein
VDDFEIINSVTIVRYVEPRRGRPYQHTCDIETLKEVCHTIDECNGRRFTGEDLVAQTDLPHTQVFVALAFLKERSIVNSCYPRRHKAAGDDCYLDAMTEFHAMDWKLTAAQPAARRNQQ